MNQNLHPSLLAGKLGLKKGSIIRAERDVGDPYQITTMYFYVKLMATVENLLFVVC